MAVAAVTWVGTKTMAVDSAGTWNKGTQNTDIQIEGTQCRGLKISSTTDRIYFTAGGTGTPFNFAAGQANDGDHIYVWLGAMTAVDTRANGGLGIVIVDDLTTDSIGEWYVGKDVGYLNGWASFVINPKLAFDNLVAAGSANWTVGGNPAQLTGIDGFGGMFKTLTSPTGNSPTSFVDAMAVGKGYRVTNGDDGSPKCKFKDYTDFEDFLSGTTSVNKYGGIRAVSGVPFVKGKLYIGFASGAGNTIFEDNGFTVIWEDARVADTFYELALVKGSGSTTVALKNGLLAAASPQKVALSFAGVNSVTIENLTVDRARLVTLDAACSWIGGTIKNSGMITLSGAATFKNLAIRGCLDQFGVSISDVAQWANVSDLAFDGAGVGGAGSGAIRLNLAAGGVQINLVRITFANRVTGSHDIVIPNSVGTGLITINVQGGSTPTVNDLRAVPNYTIVDNPVTVTVTVKNADTGAAVQGARVLLLAAAGGGLPADATVTISRTGSTAYVAHTSHGLATGNKVRIRGVIQPEYRGVRTITVTGAHEYTYTVTGTPQTPATGDIKSSAVIIDADTNASGIASDTRSYSATTQPTAGIVRRGTSTTVYRAGPVSIDVSKTTGGSAVVQLIPD